jgi:peptide/nickel transport system permease protein
MARHQGMVPHQGMARHALVRHTPYSRLVHFVTAKYAASKSAVIGACLVILLVLIALGAPLLAPHDPRTMDFTAPLAGPTINHLFGTDNFGRDVLSRVLYGYRISLAVALGSVGLALGVGIPLGLIAGYFGGWPDHLIMRPMDVLMAFPAIVLVVALAGLLGNQIPVMILAVAVVYVPIIVRVMRGTTLEISQELFVEGARARGAPTTRLLFLHVLPNAISPVLIQASILMGIGILIESALSFIGLGTQPPDPSLGLMLSEGRAFMGEAPWMVVFPGVAITIAVLGFNSLGNGLQELLNPIRKNP